MRLITIIILLRRAGLDPNMVRMALENLRAEEGDLPNSPYYTDEWPPFVSKPYMRVYKGSSLRDGMRGIFPHPGPVFIASPGRLLRIDDIQWSGKDGKILIRAGIIEYPWKRVTPHTGWIIENTGIRMIYNLDRIIELNELEIYL